MKAREPAWKPVAYTEAEAQAMRSLALGEATPAQQALALDWIVTVAGGVNEVSYFSDADGGDRETAFMEGRRFVGLQVQKLAVMPPSILARMREREAERRKGTE